jgi:integrase
MSHKKVRQRYTPEFKKDADSWIKITVPATCKEPTLSDYQDILANHVLPVFGCQTTTAINRGMIKDFLLTKLGVYANSTVVHFKNVVSGVLNKAVDDEIIPANPYRTQDRKAAINPLDVRDIEHTLGHR